MMNHTNFPGFRLTPLLLWTLLATLPAAAQPRDPVLEKARQEARSEDRDKRKAAMEALIAAGEEGKVLLRPILQRQLEREIKQLRALPRSALGKKIRRLARPRLESTRKEALTVIYDRSIYPDENHGAVGQPTVDEKVNAVRAIWETPVQSLRQELPAVDRLLHDLELSFSMLPAVGGLAPPPDLPDLAHCLAWLNQELNIPSLDESNALARREEQVRQAIQQVETEASPGEIKVVLLLNAYRRMMGRHPVAPHLLLMRAARKHSQEMEDLQYFSHSSPTPEFKTPSMRAAREGYGGSCAENIARAGSPEGAHNGWYHSSGHHRNMLGRHRVIGLGCSSKGGFWTQMFGSGGLPGGARKAAANTWLTYLKRAQAVPPHDLNSHRALAAWCRENNLFRAMEREARLVLQRAPDDAETRKLLDESRHDGPWGHAADRTAQTADSTPAAIQALKLLLDHDDPYTRLRAVRALAALFEPAAEKWLIRALKDDHPDVRIEACLGLMAGIGPQVESALKSVLRDRDPNVRHFATAALYRRGNATGIATLLKEALDGPDDVRASAGSALTFIAHQDFGFSWSDDPAARKAALERALEWFKSQRSGFDNPPR